MALAKVQPIRELISQMAQDHAIGRDVALIGARGSGKSAICRRFGELFGYEVEVLPLYKVSAQISPDSFNRKRVL